MTKRHPAISLEKMQSVDAEIAACVAAGRDPLELVFLPARDTAAYKNEWIGRQLDEWPQRMRDWLAKLIREREAAAVERYKTEFQPEAEADEYDNRKE